VASTVYLSKKGFCAPSFEIYIMTKIRPDIISIFAQVPPNKMLVDQRHRRRFTLFGNVLAVARQYGIKFELKGNGIEFSAPKSRMQMFVEKLHFSQIPYREIR